MIVIGRCLGVLLGSFGRIFHFLFGQVLREDDLPYRQKPPKIKKQPMSDEAPGHSEYGSNARRCRASSKGVCCPWMLLLLGQTHIKGCVLPLMLLFLEQTHVAIFPAIALHTYAHGPAVSPPLNRLPWCHSRMAMITIENLLPVNGVSHVRQAIPGSYYTSTSAYRTVVHGFERL